MRRVLLGVGSLALLGLLNYTTKIDPDQTAQEIAKCLSLHGASAVLTEHSPENSYVSATLSK